MKRADSRKAAAAPRCAKGCRAHSPAPRAPGSGSRPRPAFEVARGRREPRSERLCNPAGRRVRAARPRRQGERGGYFISTRISEGELNWCNYPRRDGCSAARSQCRSSRSGRAPACGDRLGGRTSRNSTSAHRAAPWKRSSRRGGRASRGFGPETDAHASDCASASGRAGVPRAGAGAHVGVGSSSSATRRGVGVARRPASRERSDSRIRAAPVDGRRVRAS